MKILIVEDDKNLADFMQKGLSEAGYKSEIAFDGISGLDMALEHEYDVIVADIMLPRLDGFRMIRRIRERQPLIPILILSAKRSVEDRVQGLELGSDDYLVKPFSFAELLARIRALLRRASGQKAATELCAGNMTVDLVRRKVSRAGRYIELAPKEFALLEYLVRNRDRVLTRTQILEHVWGYQFDPESNVVDVHVCHLREKIDKDQERPLIHTIRGVGYVIRDEN